MSVACIFSAALVQYLLMHACGSVMWKSRAETAFIKIVTFEVAEGSIKRVEHKEHKSVKRHAGIEDFTAKT